MNEAELISSFSKTPGLPFLVIGGHAVIHHGYPRSTIDLDLLVKKADRQTWVKAITALGFGIFCEHENFAQFSPPPNTPPLDLMFVNDVTFEGLYTMAEEVNFFSTKTKLPCLEHLFALKLHVLKQGLKHRVLPDIDDLIKLALSNHLNLRTEHWKKLFEKYGNLELYEKIVRATAE